MTKVVFTTDRGEWHQQAALQAAPSGLEVTMLRAPDPSTLNAALGDAQYLISERSGTIDAQTIQNAPELKLIQRLGSMTHDIDLEAAKAAGVAVCYWPIDSVIHVAEHIVMQMLALAKKLKEVEKIALAASADWCACQRTDEDTFAYNWSGRTGVRSLWQRTVGILGFGEIGIELARRLQGWHCTLLYHKRTPLPKPAEQDLQVTYADLDSLYTKSDYLVSLLPYSRATDMQLNAQAFDRMKPDAYLVHCGSGSTIDETALAEAVLAGKLAGVALDTFEWEPIKPDNPLIAAAREGHNVLLTPHTAAGTADPEKLEHTRAHDYTNINHHMNGQPLLYPVI